MPRYKVRGGEHDHYGKVYGPGEIVETELPLDEMFRGKFEKLPEAPKRVEPQEIAVPSPEVVDSDERGEDVTHKLEIPDGVDLLVFRKNNEYFVYDEDGLIPSAEVRLTSKAKTEAFIMQIFG